MKAIDVHAHVTPLFGYRRTFGDQITDALEKYYKVKDEIKTEEEMVKDFRDLDIQAIIIAWDAEHTSGLPRIENDYVADLAKRYADTFVGAWAMVDPWKGKMAVQEVERAVKELGMLGVKFQAVAQSFYPDDRLFYPIYEKCSQLGAPVSFHVGSTGLGAGLPGGGGYRLSYTRPIPHIDNVAADFPELTIIMIHPAWPWHEEQIAVLRHKTNVYADLSGYAPRYFPDPIKREINGRLQDRFMFGSDYPEIPPKRWLDEFEAGGYKPEVVEKVLYKNAQKILGI
ncbi:amidohydrolase family protein [Thermodesulfobacteriota bacterium]